MVICKRSNVRDLFHHHNVSEDVDAISDQERLDHVQDLLHKWIVSQDSLPKNYDKAMARSFIRGCKYNLEITKKKLSGYFEAKKSCPELYSCRNPTLEDIRHAIKTTNIVFLPRLTADNERILVASLNDPNPNNFDVNAILKLFLMIYDLLLTSDVPATGEILIFDAKDFSTAHGSKFISPTIKNFLRILRVGYAISVKQIHIVNASDFIDFIVKSLRPFVHEKIRDRFVVHKKTDTLKDYIDLKLLPEDFGGAQGLIQDKKAAWKKVLEEHSDWFREQENVQMSGEASKKIKFVQQFGVEGSFRKLNLD